MTMRLLLHFVVAVVVDDIDPGISKNTIAPVPNERVPTFVRVVVRAPLVGTSNRRRRPVDCGPCSRPVRRVPDATERHYPSFPNISIVPCKRQNTWCDRSVEDGVVVVVVDDDVDGVVIGIVLVAVVPTVILTVVVRAAPSTEVRMHSLM